MHALTGADLLLCPICRQRLAVADGSFVCEQRHSFDRAREGYVNLLRTRRTGDSKEMLLARRAFLDRGHYAPLARQLCRLAQRALDAREQSESPAVILDAGCGEGYYLAQLMHSLGSTPGMGACVYLGLDSAKEAARLASKRCPEA
ncbi:MAG TPA: 23S rRNA (guanine(745)-N(1))-methyltransferase, partial [Chloroflexota bacterium]|nr:23S rRNA (guanine(745)-N(1))-methyltransferase [Chloroflexota bacterium]